MLRVLVALLAALQLSKALTPDDFKGKNVVLFLTDQERETQHFPPGWVARNMPGQVRLMKNGMSFTNAFTASCMCSPARSSIMSGYFPAQHGVISTLELDMPPSHYPAQNFPKSIPNIATVMKAAGYIPVYKGKFHVTNPTNPNKSWTSEDPWSPEDVEQYGWTRWNPPDRGANQNLNEGGGNPNGGGNWDHYYMYATMADNGTEGVLEYIRTQATKQQPFFLVISLINPHDVLFFPRNFNESGYPKSMLEGEIEIPETYDETLLPTKPTAQTFQSKLVGVMNPTPNNESRLMYLNFYANLIKKNDKYLVEILDALDEVGLTNNTVVIKTSDHGEMGLAHGDMVQKSFVAYEEAIKVPMIWSNPQLYPQPYVSEALISHVDLLPTLANLFRAPRRARAQWQGVDYSKVLMNPGFPRKVQDYIAFMFFDVRQGQSKGAYVPPPNMMYSVREERYKISVYFDPNWLVTGRRSQYEMYDLKQDPLETNNLAFPQRRTPQQQAAYERLQAKLQTVIATRFQGLPLPRVVNMNGTFNMASQSRTTVPGVQAIVDEGSVNGPPVGQGNITISWLFYLNDLRPNPRTGLSIYPATCDFNITSKTGTIMGQAKAEMALNTTDKTITWIGAARFLSGTAAFQGINSTDLAFTGSDNTAGTAGRVDIRGVAYY